MAKTIVLQGHKQELHQLLTAQGYHVLDPYEAHHRRHSVDAYLYSTYHPEAFTSSLADLWEPLTEESSETYGIPACLAINIAHLTPAQVLKRLKCHFQQSRPDL